MANDSRQSASPVAVGRASNGFIIVMTTLFVILASFAVRPLVKDWFAREAKIASARAQLDQLSAIVANASVTNTESAERDALLATQRTRVLRAKSRTLAASALQSMVQDMADASHVTVTRLDVANIAGGADLPLTLSANGDIYGLTDLLRQFGSGRYAVDVEKLQVQVNSALRGAPDVLQMTLSLRAPVIVE